MKYLAIFVFSAVFLSTGCTFTYFLLNNYSKNIGENSWQWGDLEPGSKLRATKDMKNRVFEHGRKRIYNPHSSQIPENQASIKKNEVFQVQALKEQHTGSSIFHSLVMIDEFGKKLVLSTSARNFEDGPYFTRENLKNIGFEIQKSTGN